MLAVLSDTSVSGGHMTAVLAGLCETSRHLDSCCCGVSCDWAIEEVAISRCFVQSV
jgi:hypothetical protein